MTEEKRYCPACGTRVALSAKECLVCGASLKRLERRGRITIPIFVPAAFLAAIILTGLAAVLVFGFRQNVEPTSVAPTSTSTSTATAASTPTATSTATSTATATVVPTSTPTSTPTATPTPTPTLTPTPTTTPTATSTPTPTSTLPPTPTPTIYTVKRGDTLSLIAAMYGTTVEAIAEANGIPPLAILSIGQQLIIPYPGPTGGVIPGMPTIPAGEIITYVVQRGDSLYSIANLYGTTVEVLMMVNGITDPELIQVGQELIISWEEPTPTATATPEPTPTPTPQPTSTPTTTPSFTPSATPPSTPQPTPQSTPPPMPTPTLAYPYPAPALLAPADGQVFQGTDQAIVLTWASVGILAQDEWYVVRLQYEAEGMDQPPNAWTKTTSWRVPAEVYPSSDVASRLFRWDVTIKRQTHTGPDGAPEGVDMSPVSSTRSFYWY